MDLGFRAKSESSRKAAALGSRAPRARRIYWKHHRSIILYDSYTTRISHEILMISLPEKPLWKLYIVQNKVLLGWAKKWRVSRLISFFRFFPLKSNLIEKEFFSYRSQRQKCSSIQTLPQSDISSIEELSILRNCLIEEVSIWGSVWHSNLLEHAAVGLEQNLRQILAQKCKNRAPTEVCVYGGARHNKTHRRDKGMKRSARKYCQLSCLISPMKVWISKKVWRQL